MDDICPRNFLLVMIFTLEVLHILAVIDLISPNQKVRIMWLSLKLKRFKSSIKSSWRFSEDYLKTIFKLFLLYLQWSFQGNLVLLSLALLDSSLVFFFLTKHETCNLIPRVCGSDLLLLPDWKECNNNWKYSYELRGFCLMFSNI